MVEAAAIRAVTARVTGHAANVTLGDLGHEPFDGTARVREVEQLGLAVTVVEVESSIARAAVRAAPLNSDSVEDSAVALDVDVAAGRLCCAPCRIRRLHGVAIALTRLVALPGFGRVVSFATGHMGILSRDTWGNEALEHVTLGATA